MPDRGPLFQVLNSRYIDELRLKWTRMGGMHSDLPDPTYDCTDPMVTMNCISLVMEYGTGEFFEYLWIDEALSVGSISMPVEGYGVFSTIYPPYSSKMNVFVKMWPSTPATFEESMVVGDDPPTLDIRGIFSDVVGSGAGSSTGTNFREARINGWAAHTTDYGDAKNTVMVAAFAATWIDINDATVRFRGTLKGYFKGMDIKK